MVAKFLNFYNIVSYRKQYEVKLFPMKYKCSLALDSIDGNSIWDYPLSLSKGPNHPNPASVDMALHFFQVEIQVGELVVIQRPVDHLHVSF